MLDLWGRVSVVVWSRYLNKVLGRLTEGKFRGFCICAAKRLIIDVGTVRRCWLVLVGSRQGYMKRGGEKLGVFEITAAIIDEKNY